MGIDHAENELKLTLNASPQHNLIKNNNSILIKDEITAIKIAETILFTIYGQNQIEKQKTIRSMQY